jgi:hypothetical protein
MRATGIHNLPIRIAQGRIYVDGVQVNAHPSAL